ncbi:hypothetical protein [Luteimonas arsenica]|uniref:hypothetical protein n=1 Tax=Luteimonas arsenica TaxID=1586242 RepID=UPI0010542620|nr:hypothetical protein [Luteimonas arsenica]
MQQVRFAEGFFRGTGAGSEPVYGQLGLVESERDWPWCDVEGGTKGAAPGSFFPRQVNLTPLFSSSVLLRRFLLTGSSRRLVVKRVIVFVVVLAFAGSLRAQENDGRSIESAQRFIAEMASAGQITLFPDGTSPWPTVSAFNDGFGEGRKGGGVGCRTEFNQRVDHSSRTYIEVAWSGVTSVNASATGEIIVEGGVRGGSRKLKTSPEYAQRMAAAFNFLRESCKPRLSDTGF